MKHNYKGFKTAVTQSEISARKRTKLARETQCRHWPTVSLLALSRC